MLENKTQKLLLLVMIIIILPILFNYSVNRLLSVWDGIIYGSLVLLGELTSLLIYNKNIQ